MKSSVKILREQVANVFKEYDDIDALLADQANQFSNRIYKVIDANDDPNITFPNGETKLHAYYEYKETPNSDIGDYDLIGAPFADGGSGSGGGVQSVTGDGVGGTAEDVVLTFPTPTEIGAIEDAPSDGKVYGRKDADWEEVVIPDPIDLSTGLEAIDEGNGIGWRLKGTNPDNYGDIGKGAIDLGANNSASNSVGATGEYSNVGGGYQNEASGYLSTVGGGHQNKASGSNSFVGGGSYNEASESNSFIGAGLQNEASGDRSFIGGGHQNKTSAKKSTVGGGRQNQASGDYSTISGGYLNKSSGQSSTVGGGTFNEAIGDNSAVSGGVYNIAKTFGEFLGGLWATIKEGNATDWIGTDRVFGIGNGTRFDSRSDAFNVYKNGVAELPSVTNALIDAAGGKTIPTKEWVQQQAIDPAPAFIPADHDLDEFKNESVDPYVRESELPGGGSGLQLGETSSTAYRGDRGKIAYDHTSETNNPHSVTKAQVGLGNVDNTSDMDKPVSTAQAAADTVIQNDLNDYRTNQVGTNFPDYSAQLLAILNF